MAKKYIAPNGRKPVYLREWLDHLGKSQQYLADRMQTDKANITKWLQEPWRITLDVLSEASTALGIGPNDLFLLPEEAERQKRALAAIQEAAQAPKHH